jgi:hypothetical protein
MITTVRTANVHDGKIREALAWALKATKFLNEKFGTNIQVARNVGGPLFQVHWVATYKSLADFERISKQVEADEGYQALVTEGRQQDIFIGTSIVDSIYETVG